MIHPDRRIHTSEINNPLLETINLSDHENLVDSYKNLIEVDKGNLYL